MTPKLAAIVILVLFAFALGQGCTSPVIPPDARPSETAPPTPAAPGSVTIPPPGPVVTVPPDFDIEIQINKNMIFVNPDIDVYFRGGKGQLFLQKMLVQVYKSDGTYETGQLVRPPGGQLSVGDRVRIRGTTGTDRVIVTVTILGKDYTIRDEYLEFKTRP